MADVKAYVFYCEACIGFAPDNSGCYLCFGCDAKPELPKGCPYGCNSPRAKWKRMKWEKFRKEIIAEG